MRGLAFLILLVAACRHPASDVDPAASAAPADSAQAAAAATRDDEFDAAVARIEARRTALGRAYAAAGDDPARAAIRAEARAFLLHAIRTDLFPLWIGTPWGLGSNSTATRPHQPGMTVGCSYFVTSILGNAGFELDDRYKFARAPALDIQRSLASRAEVHRFLSLPARDLERKIAALGDGLWLIGLSNHIGFVVVDGGEVHLVHASWTGDQRVTDEPFAPARAIDVSRKAGYFVSPVIVASTANDALIDAWLRGATVHFRGG